MSRPLALLLAALALAAPLAGQDTMMVRLRNRADSLLRTWREAERLADLADSLERERATAGTDTIAIGGLRIIANPSPLPLQQAAERAWPAIDSLYGSAAPEIAQQPFIIRAVDPDTAVRRSVLHVGVELPWDLDVRATTSFLLTTVAPPRFDRALAEWLGAPLRPTLRPREDQIAVLVQLITAPSEAVRGCFLGVIGRCKDVLQLTDSSGLLERWYVTPAEREALVTGSLSFYFDRGATAPSLRRCRAHDDDACTALLRSLPPGTLPRPLIHTARSVLAHMALRSGGRDAYRRLVADPTASLAARLSSAAGMDIDSLVIRWRNDVLAARPARLTLPWWASVAAVGWTVLFGFCALRSSRWRL
jgi:hypothetical protein